jgi:hypothetical protein
LAAFSDDRSTSSTPKKEPGLKHRMPQIGFVIFKDRLAGRLKAIQLALDFHHPSALFAPGGFHFPPPLHAGLLIELPFAQLGEDSRFLTFFFKSPQSLINGLMFFDENQTQSIHPLPSSWGIISVGPSPRLDPASPGQSSPLTSIPGHSGLHSTEAVFSLSILNHPNRR